MLISIVFLTLLTSTLHSQKYFVDSLQSCIEQDFGTGCRYNLRELIMLPQVQNTIESAVGQRFASESLYYGVIRRNEKVAGYYFVDTLRARMNTFDILVLYDKNSVIHSVYILRNPDKYNQAINDKNWLHQFQGKRMLVESTNEKQIDSISGATLSSLSLIKGLQRLSLLLQYMIRK